MDTIAATTSLKVPRFASGSLRSQNSRSSHMKQTFHMEIPILRVNRGVAKLVMASSPYICMDCGYIYNARTPFDQLSSDYRCPVCQAPKRRFKAYKEPVTRNANDLSVRKARKATIKAEETSGSSLPILIAAIVAVLVGVFIFLNSQY